MKKSLLWLITVFTLMLSPFTQGQTPVMTTLMKLDELENLLSANQFEALLDYHSKSPTAKWPKIYSAEFCIEQLKGKKQEEALQTRKFAEMLVTQLKAYQRKLKNMPLDELAKAVNKLLDLRDSLSEPGYGNMVLQLCIEEIATFRVAERVVMGNEDLKVLEALMRRNNQWKHEWRIVCQMIEEEEDRKQFDYAAMERMKKSELYNPANLGWEDKKQQPIGNPKLLFGRYDLDNLLGSEHADEITFQGVLQKRSFNGFLHRLYMGEFFDRSSLPGLILFKQRGGNFKGKWKDNFDKLMVDYVENGDLIQRDMDSFGALIEIARDVDENNGGAFMFDMSGVGK